MSTSLLDLPTGAVGIIRSVHSRNGHDDITERLRELGFVPGEPVRVVAHAPFGRDPIAVQVGTTRFALRRTEAERILVEAGAA